jgi:hypothetical protein
MQRPLAFIPGGAVALIVSSIILWAVHFMILGGIKVTLQG